MQIEDFYKFVNTQTWIFSKSMKRAPHWYICKDYLKEEMLDDFENAVIFIRQNGIKAYFWGKPYIYYEIGGFFYWTMGNPIEQTKIINRASSKQYKIIRKENYNIMEIIK